MGRSAGCAETDRRPGEIDDTDDCQSRRVTPEQWGRVENVAADRMVSANQIVVELAMEAIDRHGWSRTNAKIHFARTTMFVAPALVTGKTCSPDSVQRITPSPVLYPAEQGAPLSFIRRMLTGSGSPALAALAFFRFGIA